MPAAYRHQELHPKGQPQLLRALLREAVCHAVCALQEGTAGFLITRPVNHYMAIPHFSWLSAPFPNFLQPITTGGVTYRDQPWHKDCFLCTSCKLQLSGQRFTSRDDFAYCLNCFCNLYAKKCASCTTPISGNRIRSLAKQNIKYMGKTYIYIY